MARDAESYFPDGTPISKVRKIVELLGFVRAKDWRQIEGNAGSYIWYEKDDYRSWTGVSLSIYLGEAGLTVQTRSGYSGSFWDVRKHNEALRVLREFVGGHFESDHGRNKLFPNDSERVAPIASGCFIARWRLENAIYLAKQYRIARKLDGSLAIDGPHEVPFLNELNPLLFSNNMLLPYLVAVWEDYFRSLFIACLREVGMTDRIRSNLNPAKIKISMEPNRSVEEIVASHFSFQRPVTIARNFQLLSNELNLEACWRRGANGRTSKLLDQITQLVDDRNNFVHVGSMNMKLFNKSLGHSIARLLRAADLAHTRLGEVFKFEPIEDY